MRANWTACSGSGWIYCQAQEVGLTLSVSKIV